MNTGSRGSRRSRCHAKRFVEIEIILEKFYTLSGSSTSTAFCHDLRGQKVCRGLDFFGFFDFSLPSYSVLECVGLNEANATPNFFEDLEVGL